MTIGGKAYPNGRNQESSSEAIAAYEAVAMYGDAMVSHSLSLCIFFSVGIIIDIK